MSDELTPRDLDGPPTLSGTPAGSGGGLKAFFGTTAGKVVLVGGALAVLAVVVAVVALLFLGTMFGGTSQEAANPVPTGAGKPAASASTEETAPAVPAVENREVFTPRDPFQKVIVPASALATATSSAAVSDTLVLTQIIDDAGVRKGVFTLNGTTYTVGDGERLGSTSWQVVTIGTSSATMLYGDTRIVVTLGEGIQTK